MDDFETYRPLLFSIAYRMLGSAMEAEDILQEAYLRYSGLPEGQIQLPKAYLSRTVTNLCLDQLKSAREQREVYIGPWLPEPLLTDDRTDSDEMDSISMAFLLLLEKLSPAERAVFLLHEVFDYEYPEIAGILDKDQATCRQLLHRAKQHIVQNRPRFKPNPDDHKLIFAQFMTAVSEGDLNGLVSMLAEEATSWSDSGGKTKAARRVLVGRERVAAFILGLARKASPDVIYEPTMINAAPAVIVWDQGSIRSVLVVEIENGLVKALRFVLNPDKLRYLLRQVQG